MWQVELGDVWRYFTELPKFLSCWHRERQTFHQINWIFWILPDTPLPFSSSTAELQMLSLSSVWEQILSLFFLLRTDAFPFLSYENRCSPSLQYEKTYFPVYSLWEKILSLFFLMRTDAFPFQSYENRYFLFSSLWEQILSLFVLMGIDTFPFLPFENQYFPFYSRWEQILLLSFRKRTDTFPCPQILERIKCTSWWELSFLSFSIKHVQYILPCHQ